MKTLNALLAQYPKETIKQSFLEEYKIREARQNFWAYRQYINPPKKLKVGWWQKELAGHLQQFCFDLENNLAPILLIEAPPQHGKSVQIIDFLTWVIGRNPHLEHIYAAFSSRLSVRANLRIRRILNSDLYKQVFPKIELPTFKDKGYTLNRGLIELMEQTGSFRNTTVQGAVSGESLDLGIIDDPLKGRQEANSPTVRDNSWGWFTSDFMTRFSENAGLLFILTRWHVDDIVGRFQSLVNDEEEDNALKNSEIKILKYKAIAMEAGVHRKKGEVLFPEHKSLEFILRQKKILGLEAFESLYQQNPIVPGGGIFKKKYMVFIDAPRVSGYEQIVMSVDTAYKADSFNDASAIGIWGVHSLGYDLLYVACKRILYPQLKKLTYDLADIYANKKELYSKQQLFTILIEDKSSGQALIPEIRQDRNYNVHPVMPTADKLTRAHVCLPQFEARKVFIIKGGWTEDYIKELISFRGIKGDNADQVDMTSQFLTHISIMKSGDITEDMMNKRNTYSGSFDNDYNLQH